MKDTGQSWDLSPKKYVTPLFMLFLFLAIGITFWLTKGHIFYLFNFGYIGLSISVGSFLAAAMPRKKRPVGRMITQGLVGAYMFGFLGLVAGENMQIEGFFMYLILGIFAGATIHYLIAKIAGTLFFGRAWCGYACWTAAVLDLLPFKRPAEGRLPYWGILRYVHFFLSLGLVLFTFYILQDGPAENPRQEYLWFLIGNAFYFACGIALAYILKDNRAFCKYICPIPVFQKIGSRFALLKVEIDPKGCTDCGLCEKVCLMNIKLLEYKARGQRVLSSECIFCETCVHNCPQNTIKTSLKLDGGFSEFIHYKKKTDPGDATLSA